jgi:hypothetical protein
MRRLRILRAAIIDTALHRITIRSLSPLPVRPHPVPFRAQWAPGRQTRSGGRAVWAYAHFGYAIVRAYACVCEGGI